MGTSVQAVPTPPNTNTATSLAVIGYGSAFSIGDLSQSPINYTQVIEITDIDWAGVTIGKEDVTNLGSPQAYREYKPTLVDPGTLSIEGNWIDDSTQQGMYGMATSRTIFAFKIATVLQLGPNSGKTYTVSGYGFFEKITTMTKITADKAIKFSAQLQVTGPLVPTLT